MNAKLTPWFPGDVKPVRVGVYQRDYRDIGTNRAVVVYCRWDGKYFHAYGETAQQAATKDCTSSGQSLAWRGLAEPPK